MTDKENPLDEAVEQALDAFVYAPLGLLLDGPGKYPDLVRNGKNQVTNARMMGQFTVQMGRSEAIKRASKLDGPVRDVLQGLGVVPRRPAPPATTEASRAATTARPGAAPAPSTDDGDASSTTAATKKKATKKKTATKKKATKKKTATKKKATKKKTATKKRSAPAVSSLPVPDYDSLSASQVTSRLRGLSESELTAVQAYEAANRARKTVLGRVEQLLGR